jgi:hypothetical protein
MIGAVLYHQKLKMTNAARNSVLPDNQGVATVEAEVADIEASEIDAPVVVAVSRKRQNAGDNNANYDDGGVHPNVPQYKDQARTVVKPQAVDVGGTEEVPVVSARLADGTLVDEDMGEKEDVKPHRRLDP